MAAVLFTSWLLSFTALFLFGVHVYNHFQLQASCWPITKKENISGFMPKKQLLILFYLISFYSDFIECKTKYLCFSHANKQTNKQKHTKKTFVTIGAYPIVISILFAFFEILGITMIVMEFISPRDSQFIPQLSFDSLIATQNFPTLFNIGLITYFFFVLFCFVSSPTTENLEISQLVCDTPKKVKTICNTHV